MENNLDILFLDDDESRAEYFLRFYPDAVWVKTAEDCIEKLAAQGWSQVFLDHDLGGEVYVDTNREDCGMEVIRWLVENKPERLNKTTFIIHTMNPVGEVMVKMLHKIGFRVTYMPFAFLMDQLNLIAQPKGEG